MLRRRLWRGEERMREGHPWAQAPPGLALLSVTLNSRGLHREKATFQFQVEQQQPVRKRVLWPGRGGEDPQPTPPSKPYPRMSVCRGKPAGSARDPSGTQARSGSSTGCHQRSKN